MAGDFMRTLGCLERRGPSLPAITLFMDGSSDLDVGTFVERVRFFLSGKFDGMVFTWMVALRIWTICVALKREALSALQCGKGDQSPKHGMGLMTSPLSHACWNVAKNI